MIALAIDTSSLDGSVAVSADDGRVEELVFAAESTHSEKLLPAIEEILIAARTRLHDVDVFAVAAGPGSFTGLRIGIASAKGLAMATSRPLLGFSTLETMALACAGRKAAGRAAVCVMLDAGRGEVYRGLFDVSDGRARCLSPEAALPPERAARDLPANTIVCGGGAIAYRTVIDPMLPSSARLVAATPPLAAELASRALRRASEGGLGQVPPLVPNYLRLSDAERNYSG